jgi:hypothetical protein
MSSDTAATVVVTVATLIAFFRVFEALRLDDVNPNRRSERRPFGSDENGD